MIIIGNDWIQRAFTVEGGRLRTLWIANSNTGTKYAVGRDSEEFAVEFVTEVLRYRHGGHNPVRLTSQDFQVISAVAEGKVATHGVFELMAPKLRMRLLVEVSADEKGPWLRKRLRFMPQGHETASICRFDVESLVWEAPAPRHGGFGQPLLGEDWFAGVEYPAGEAECKNAVLRCGHFGLDTLMVGEEATSESVVWGAAGTEGARTAFFEYIDAMRYRPIRRYVHYNSWYDLQGDDLNETNLRERIDMFDRELTQKRGVTLDGFVLDDGWDDLKSAWEIESARFPKGFAPLVDALEPLGVEFGIWYGPSGGYGQVGRERRAWFEANGYELTATTECLCLAGTRYHTAFLKQLREKLEALPISYLKLDGMPFACNRSDHGHPVGMQSREALIRAFLRVLETIREVRPEAFVSMTTGAWLSPWWLQWADAVFIGGDDFNYAKHLPTYDSRAAAITYRDGVMHEDFRQFDDHFPISSVMSVGVIKGQLALLGDANESLDAWKTEFVMEVGRGIGQMELYLSPQVLTDAEWDEAAQAITWARAHDDLLLSHGEMVLGDPNRGEVYGYLHKSANESVVVLRNPSYRPQWAEWDPSWVAAHTDGPHVLWQLHPTPKALCVDAASFGERILIQPFEAVMFHCRPLADHPGVFPLGVPVAITGDDEATWYVPDPGASVLVTGPEGARLEIADDCRVDLPEGGVRVTLEAPSAQTETGVDGADCTGSGVTAFGAGGAWSIARTLAGKGQAWEVSWDLDANVVEAELMAVGEWEAPDDRQGLQRRGKGEGGNEEDDFSWSASGKGAGAVLNRQGKGGVWTVGRVLLERQGRLTLEVPAEHGRVSVWLSLKRTLHPVVVRAQGAPFVGAASPVTVAPHLVRETQLLWDGGLAPS